jgi:putative ABC transport system ATP-binding protein
MDEVLQVRGLRRTFASDGAPVRALRGVDLALARGAFAAVMGPSGCGKSTLLNLIAGLDTPTEGEVVVAGTPLGSLDENGRARLRRRHVGFVFQFFHLLGDMHALDNVALPAATAGATRREAERRALELLDLLGLGEHAHALPAALSGGQRQRLAIARALANEPTLLLADEPTGALDSEGGGEILELLRRLHAGGQTILLVTHDRQVGAAAERIVEMRDGIILDAPEPAVAGPAPR